MLYPPNAVGLVAYRWHRYALVMSAAFDTGSAITLCFVLLAFTINSSYRIMMPFYALNRIDQESCAPGYYLTVGSL